MLEKHVSDLRHQATSSVQRGPAGSQENRWWASGKQAGSQLGPSEDRWIPGTEVTATAVRIERLKWDCVWATPQRSASSPVRWACTHLQPITWDWEWGPLGTVPRRPSACLLHPACPTRSGTPLLLGAVAVPANSLSSPCLRT